MLLGGRWGCPPNPVRVACCGGGRGSPTSSHGGGGRHPTSGLTPFRRVPREYRGQPPHPLSLHTLGRGGGSRHSTLGPTLIEGVPRGYRGQPPPLSLNTLGRGEGSRHSTLGPTLLEGVPRGFGAASSLQTWYPWAYITDTTLFKFVVLELKKHKY